MKAEELRIGNLVYADGHFKSIKEIDWDSFSMSEYYNPIPLTVEWLTGFGYSEENKKNFLGQFGLLKNIEGEYVLSYLDENRLTRFNNIKIEYVHQLQNLYFALTGKELEMLS